MNACVVLAAAEWKESVHKSALKSADRTVVKEADSKQELYSVANRLRENQKIVQEQAHQLFGVEQH